MSKTKSSDKIHYELLCIIPNKFTAEEAKAIDEKVKKEITGLNGEITYSEDWGNKELAYAIRGFNHGYYKLVEFDLFGVELSKLDNFLRLSSDILRHQIIRTKKRSPQQIAADNKRAEDLYRSRRSQKSSPVAEKEKTAPVVSSTPVSSVIETPAKSSIEVVAEENQTEQTEQVEEKKFSKKKTDLKDLDKKLEDILETNDLL